MSRGSAYISQGCRAPPEAREGALEEGSAGPGRPQAGLSLSLSPLPLYIPGVSCGFECCLRGLGRG